MRFELHAVIERRAVAAGAPRWAADLPATVETLGREWGFEVVEQLAGGMSSLVLRVRRVRRTGSTPAVLKLAVPDTDFAREVDTLRRAAGRGYVRVLEADIGRHAVLLEELGPPLSRSGLPPVEQLVILAGLVQLAWEVPRPAGEPAYDKASDLAFSVEKLWSPGSCDRRVVDEALRCAEARAAAFDPDRCVVVHGDAAAVNALRAPKERGGGYLLTDPDGFVGDPVYDLGVAIRDWCPQVLADPSVPRRYAAVLADETGTNATAVEEWGFLERVSTGLFVLGHGGDKLARLFLRSAEAIIDRRHADSR